MVNTQSRPKHFLEFLLLIFGYRRARIAFYAALPEAFGEVAYKKFFGEVKAHQGILYLEHDFFCLHVGKN